MLAVKRRERPVRGRRFLRIRYTFMRDGVWQVQLPVQSEARPHMPPPYTGLTEIWRSLETGDETLAEIRRGPIVSELLTIWAAAIEAAKWAGHAYTLYPGPPQDATFRRGSDGLFEIDECQTDFAEGRDLHGRPPDDAVMTAPDKYVRRGGWRSDDSFLVGARFWLGSLLPLVGREVSGFWSL